MRLFERVVTEVVVAVVIFVVVIWTVMVLVDDFHLPSMIGGIVGAGLLRGYTLARDINPK